jgi:hypothetical protein
MTSENRVLTWVWLLLVSSTLLSFAAAGGGEAARIAGIVVWLTAVGGMRVITSALA